VLARATSSRLKQRGVFSVGSDGLIDLKKARAAIAGNRSIAHAYMDDVNERQRGVVPAASTEPPLTGEPLVEDSPEPGTTATTRRQFERARTIRESFNASMARLQFQERSGLLVERMVAERVLFEKARFARDAWLAWPSKTAPLLAAELGIENSEALLTALSAHVHKQITALGAGTAEFRNEPRT
jgi:hypothetical protein